MIQQDFCKEKTQNHPVKKGVGCLTGIFYKKNQTQSTTHSTMGAPNMEVEAQV